MNILVTGAAGYIGSVVTEVLIDQDHSVVALDNLQAGHREAVHPNAVFVQADLGDAQALDQVFRDHDLDAVVHMAAEALVSVSMSNPRRFFSTNVRGGMNLLDAMLSHEVKKIIFSSTAAVYGEPKETPISEDAPTRPVNSYGDSKLMFERILDWYDRAYGLRYISLRYFNAAGASEKCGEAHDPETHLIPLILEVAMGKKEEIQVYGTDYDTPDGTCIRDYIHVLDLAKAHVLALQNLDGNKPRVYNLGNDDGDSIYQVLETARQVTGHPLPAVPAPRRSGDPARLTATSTRIRSELGWVPDYPDLHAIIETAWRWHQKRA
ncbi:MAG: UDP-glucose 4-epimerase GalE [Acidobacteria bacterium]|nr:UDP-glucose 4-epimerase GalE [Acidobacteriota bacterium]